MKDSKGNEYDGWVVIDGDGIVLHFTFRNTRTLAISVFEKYAEEPWRYWHNSHDYRVIKVRLVEVQP